MKKFFKALSLAVITIFGAAGAYAQDADEEAVIKVIVDDADAVSATINNEPLTIVTGENTITLKLYESLYFRAEDGYKIVSVVNAAGTPQSVFNNGQQWGFSAYDLASENGQVYTMTTAKMSDLRTGTCIINVDNASGVRASIDGYYTYPELVNGENVIKFEPGFETQLTISSTNYSKPLYEVKLDGVKLQAEWNSYYIPLTDGCVVDVTADYPDVDVDVTFEYTDEASFGCVAGVKVDGELVEGFDGKKVSVKLGSEVRVVFSDKYSTDELFVNNEQIGFGGTEYLLGCVLEPTTLKITAHEYATYKLTVNVTNPSYVVVSNMYGTTFELTGTSTVIGVLETQNYIRFDAAAGCYIKSATYNDVAIDMTMGGYVQVTGDGVLDIVCDKITMDDTMVVWCDDNSMFDPNKMEYLRLSASDRMTNFNIEKGYTVVPFYSGYVPFMLNWWTSTPVVGKVYLNDELKTTAYPGASYYEINAKDGDVLKVFLSEEPVDCTVDFELAEGVDVAVSRDLIVSVADPADGFSCFKGTQVVVTPAENTAVKVSVNNEALTAGEDGAYMFTVADPATKVSVENGDDTGIVSVENAAASTAVFNLQGIRVADSAENLPAGLYIVAGRKVVVK